MFLTRQKMFAGACLLASVIPQIVLADSSTQPYNIILIINDQETYQLATKNIPLPARSVLQSHGVTFKNHYTAAAMCSPSRATFLTGVPPQVHGVSDQMEYNFVNSLDSKRANIGSVLKKLGYQTAYFGKFEMDKTLLQAKKTVNYSMLAQPYGFDTFNPDGDAAGNPLQGYQDDAYFTGEAVRWLRTTVSNQKNQPQPFFMVLSLLNPHDIMYGDANLPGLPALQKAQVPVIFPPPKNSIYTRNWTFNLPDTLNESFAAPGMPPALYEYQKGWAGTLGYIPTERKDMWHYYYNYYLNALRDNDKTLLQFIFAMNEMDLWKNTIVILTADHGEMGGAHAGLRGKGPFAYEENTHIPMIVAHPKAPANSSCSAITSHLDLLPTIVGLTGLAKSQIDPVLQSFPGRNFSKLVLQPQTTDVNALRPGILFNYVGLSTIDGDYLLNLLTASVGHKPTLPPVTNANLNKRGFLTMVFDGRYKFARYYAPSAFNTPTTLDEIYKNNDLQLFDLQNDPFEKNNLALDKENNKAIILRMNTLMNELVQKEVGNNDGQFLPEAVRQKLN